jgi:hypothetical protein
MAGRRIRTITDETDENAEDLGEWPEHPLFPLTDGEKSFDVSFIHITRFENGTQKWGVAVPAHDLNSENDIFERWGGGQYVLVARAASKSEGIPGRIRKHRRVTIPGKSKPLSSDPTPEEMNLANPQPPHPPQSSNGSSGSDLVSLMGMMMQMSQQASERSAVQSQNFMQMFLGMMQNSKSDAQQMTQMMLQMTSQNQQAMMGLISTVMANRGGGPEEMAKYADLLRSLGVGTATAKETDKGGTDIASMLENAADVVQGIVALKGGPSELVNAPQGGPVAAMPQAPQEDAGGAQSFLRAAR